MAPKKGKKVINQDELRRLMREKQRQQQTTDKKKRVESPFAKYNSLGHLSCVLCNVQVKTEILWQAHVLGKPHKEKVSELKTGSKPSGSATQTPQQQQQPAPKRKAPDSEGTSISGLPGDFFEFKKPCQRAPQSATTSAGLSLLAGTYEEDEESDEEVDTDTNHKGTATTSVSSGESAPEGLPADFFDSSIPTVPSVSHSGSILKADEQQEKSTSKKDKKDTAEALPEGFFDDPVRDAKVRNVEAPKDLMDKEWDEFQKEMRQVNTKSEAIVAEDDEEGRLERQIDEIDEQIECYRRVEVLRDKRDVVKSKPAQATTQELSDQGIDEEDEEELLHLLSRDWRAKGALA